MSNRVRTRFAPSPTGRMHVGNLRTALYAYLIAKHEGGDFILRVEDTDQERYVEGATDIIYRTLAKTGLIHDEGPDKDGGYGPYIQSERQASGLYLKYAKQLVEQGDAYYCFCDKERLESLKTSVSEDGTDIVVYDKHCLGLSREEVEANLAAGKPWVIRLNVPNEGETTFHDEIYGDITVPNAELDDMILIKSDGFPTYNFANVVDDHLMEITHVVRGNEYISSTPKYNLIYEAFGWTPPHYVHVPPVMKDAQHKLSKRNGDASFQDLVAKGYLPEAIINYIALLGWNPGNDEEIFSLDELKKIFSVERLNRSPAIFDIVKLTWMNGQYIRKLSEAEFLDYAKPYIEGSLKRKVDIQALCRVLQPRLETFGDIPNQIDFLDEVPNYDNELYVNKKMKTDEAVAKTALELSLKRLEGVSEWNNDNLFTELKALAEESGMKNGQIMYPVRIALSGKAATPGGATEIAVLIGKDETLQRIKTAIEKLS